MTNDDRGHSRGVFVDPNGEVLLVHSTRGGRWGIWELPLDGSAPRPIDPPGHGEVAHATRSPTGTLSFDVMHPSLLGRASLAARSRLSPGRPAEGIR